MRPVALLLLSIGCGGSATTPDASIDAKPSVCHETELKDLPVEPNRDLDLLFLVDNTGSMVEEQTSLAASFPQFLNVLATIEGGLPNLHLGVISSDMGAGPFNISNCSGNGDNGQLQTQARVTGCTPPTGAYISDVSDGAGGRVTNYSGTMSDTFSCIAQLGINGCGFEQHLQSMRRALDGSNVFNNGFLRDAAMLGVVIVADEDDCSTLDSQMFDTSQNSVSDPLGPLSSFRCFEFGVDCESGNRDPRAWGARDNCVAKEDSDYMYGVQEYVEFLKALKVDDSQILVGAIIGNAEPVVVGDDPLRPGNPALVPSCTSASGEAAPAVRFQSLLEEFPNRSLSTSICNEDLSSALVAIGGLVKAAIGDPCFHAELADSDPSTSGLDYACTASDVLGTGESELPRCNAGEDLDPTDPPSSTNLPCWHLEVDATRCSDTPTSLALVVERGGAGAPTGTHVQVRCETTVETACP